jgi:ApaG protein
MIHQVTHGISISVETVFKGTYFKNYQRVFAFAYRISIRNQSKDCVQLKSRHWKIFDALNALDIVDGEGVVGEKPILHPGQHHSYSSGCLLSSPIGAMRGYFRMVNFTTSKKFRAYVPAFKLNAPFAIN